MDVREFLQAKFDKTSFTQFISERFYGFEENLNGDFLGRVKLDDKKELGFFVFKIDDDKDIENNRVGLNSELKKRAVDAMLDSAIAAFYNNKQQAWRLSFIRFSYDDKNKQQVSNLKKFTFVLGIPAINTAYNQLKDLKYPNTKALESAFGVEKVSNEFFAKYRSLFEKLNENISSQRALFGNEETMHAFSKKLLGRIVFLYFLQKKGWLGVPKNCSWGEGDKSFVSNIYQADSSDFYIKKLSPLFFDTLNQKRPNDYSEIFDCRIPFLNGGLLDKNSAYDERIFIGDEIFGEIFETFDGYNFTIIEDSADESEVAIDPEMLGRVFENLLEENYRKGKGAFYTPREIVGYMCKSSLEHFLDNATKEHQYLFGVDEFLESTAMNDEGIYSFYTKYPQKYIVVENYFEKIKPYKNLIVNFRIVAKLRGFIKENDRLVKNDQYSGHLEINPTIWHKIIKKEYVYHSHIIGSNKEIRIQNRVFVYPTIIKYVQIDERFFAIAFLPNIHGDLELNTIFPVRKRSINSKTAKQNEIFESWTDIDFAFSAKVLEETKSLWRDCHSPHTVPHKSGEHNTASRFSMISHKLFRIENLADQALKKHLGLKWYDIKINKILNNSAIPQTDLTDIMLKHIKSIKVLDPAIGSGAFPMGMLHEIVQTRIHLGDKTGYAKLKREIIEKSIHGIDIDSDAVEIAKLRFWLSLTVDEESPSPLPNLDYKIMVGNSLLQTINGFDPLEKEQGSLFDSREITIQKIQDLLHEFYESSDKTRKEKLKKYIESNIDEILNKKLNEYEDQIKSQQRNMSVLDGFSKKQVEIIEKAQATIDMIEKIKIRPTKELFFYRIYFAEVLNDGGFDVVIGNPPYIRQEKIKELKPKLEIEKYQSYNGTADIYVYFFEQGYKLLKDSGVLNFITSNKYTRAKYGKEFRDFVLKNTQVLEYIDFNGVKVFESATVDTSILSFKKSVIARSETTKQSSFLYCDIGADYYGEELKNYCYKNGFDYSQSDLSAESFTFANPKELRIKKRIEEIGTPLKEWGVKIYRGILTGFNEAFIIDSAKRDELVVKDPKSAEIIKPILRGRDIKRYGYEWTGLWLVYIPWHFPNNNTNAYSDFAYNEKCFEEQYSAIYYHLLSHKEKLSARNQEETGKRYEWYAMQRFGSDYWQEFEKEKIMYPNMTAFRPFLYDTSGFFSNDKSFIISGVSSTLKYLIALLNSWLFDFAFKDRFPELLGGTRELRKVFFELLPIPKIPESDQKPFETLVDYIIFAKANALETEVKFFESVIDVMVYGLYFEESMKKADCYINDEVANLVKPFGKYDSDEFKAEYIKTMHNVMNEEKAIKRGLVFSRNVPEVEVISGEKK
jgi:Eco57I restriction-modification methylase/TaqI-like C-terminal specificity domain